MNESEIMKNAAILAAGILARGDGVAISADDAVELMDELATVLRIRYGEESAEEWI